MGHPGPRRRDNPDKNFMQVAFAVVLDREWRDVPRFGSGRPGIGKTFAMHYILATLKGVFRI